MKTFTKAILFGSVLGLFSCETDSPISDTQQITQNNKIIEAKKWFDEYKTKIDIDPMFQDMNYHWAEASRVIQEDSNELIKLPLTEKTENKNYKGEKMLYISYSNQGYIAIVHELFPYQKKITKEDMFSNLDTFSGYAINWDLQKGFINGSKLINGKDVQAIKVKILSGDKNKTHSVTRREAAIELDEVVVLGSGTSTSSLSISKDFSISSSITPNNGSGGGSSVAPAGGGGKTTLSKAEQDFLNSLNSTSPNIFNIIYALQQNQIIATASFNLLPWTGIKMIIVQNIGTKYTIQNVTTSSWGVTAGYTWSQNAYIQNTVGTTTILNIMGTLTYNTGIESIGNVYSKDITFVVQINNTNGKIISGVRLK